MNPNNPTFREENEVICKVCGELRKKIEDGKYPKGKTKKYVDQFGVQWNGKVCPQCNRDRAKKTMTAGRLLNTKIEKLLK